MVEELYMITYRDMQQIGTWDEMQEEYSRLKKKDFEEASSLKLYAVELLDIEREFRYEKNKG